MIFIERAIAIVVLGFIIALVLVIISESTKTLINKFKNK